MEFPPSKFQEKWEQRGESMEAFAESQLRKFMSLYFEPKGKYQSQPAIFKYAQHNPGCVLFRTLVRFAYDHRSFRRSPYGVHGALHNALDSLAQKGLVGPGPTGPRGGNSVKLLVKWTKL